MSKPFRPANRRRGKRSGGFLTGVGGFAILTGMLYVGAQMYFKSKAPDTPSRNYMTSEARRTRTKGRREPRLSSGKLVPSKHNSDEWKSLSRDMDECVKHVRELMTMTVKWPGFHPMCIDEVNDDAISLSLHEKSGRRPEDADPNTHMRTLVAQSLRLFDSNPPPPHPDDTNVVDSMLGSLKVDLGPLEGQRDDPMISNSDYKYPINPWRMFTAVGGPIDSDLDLKVLGRGAAVYLYVGGQFIWPGVRIGYERQVPIPVTDGSPGGHKLVTMTTASLRPLVLVLSGFLTEAECTYVKDYASSRMVPSGLAMMDSSGSAKANEDVRTSTQTFMQRGGSEEILALEERAHNLTRLPYELGENIQVVRYTEGQKYGAHRDFFNPNDYHKQPSMLRNVEYGGRNRLATVFWYLETVKDGGETFFPRALNQSGVEYHPWNGDHEDCYRGLTVPPTRGNAVLFYSMVPDGRLDERSLHGGCRPRGDTVEKWGANQWIWNHPQRMGMLSATPRRGGANAAAANAALAKPAGRPGCEDDDDNCAAWAATGECGNNPEFMSRSCRFSCNACDTVAGQRV